MTSLLHFERMRHMALPAGFVLRTLLHHIFVADGTVLTGRRHSETLEGAMTLVAFDHGQAMAGIEPFLVQVRRGFPVALITGNILFLHGELGVLLFLFSGQGHGPAGGQHQREHA